MKTTRFTQEQIAFALQQAEAGVALAEVSWKLEISEQMGVIARTVESACWIGLFCLRIKPSNWDHFACALPAMLQNALKGKIRGLIIGVHWWKCAILIVEMAVLLFKN